MMTESDVSIDASKILCMIKACSHADIPTIQSLLSENTLYARLQDENTGTSPLMAAAAAGHLQVCRLLLEHGAPWNAVDRQGLCAGNYATNHEHWNVVNFLVDEATKAELILGASIRLQKSTMNQQQEPQQEQQEQNTNIPVEQQPSTKPHYLRQRLTYNKNGTALLDSDADAVMMEWERPLMEAHASILLGDDIEGKRVLNVGFGMGIIDLALQARNPSLHVIIEAHPDVYQQMLIHKWNERPNVKICFGKWQDVLPQLIQEGLQVDAIFFDTYGEHFMDLEDFHQAMVHLLSKPNGVYSFFNGLAPDNIFFHGVACQCVQLQLSALGLDTDFLSCQIQVPEQDEWEGIRRKYWHGRDTYYLPRVTWKPTFCNNGQQSGNGGDACLHDANEKKQAACLQLQHGESAKRQKLF